MKNAFTFAELMISLVIISVITALLYPTISELAPNNNKHLFKTTFKTVAIVVDEIMNGQNETGTSPACTGQAITDVTTAINNQHNLCCQFNNRLSTASGSVNCDVNNQLQTSNGVRWWFNGANTVYVDVNASNNNITSQCTATRTTWAQGSFCNNQSTQDTFRITISTTGKISTETAGEMHLRNETED